MKRKWLWVAVAIVVGVLILGATKGKWCAKAQAPTGPGSWKSNPAAHAKFYGYDPELGP